MAPPAAMLVTFVSTTDQDEKESRSVDKSLSEGALRDIKPEIIQPLDFTLPDMETAAVSAPTRSPQTGEQRIVCEVHIHQGHAGAVQAIDFGACNGDSAWQRSLLRSIQEAARLVSPMEEGEFPPVRTLLMDTASPSPEVLARQLSESVARR